MVLSEDLRKRVVEAVVSSGPSRNVAAKRFEVSIASAVRWVKQFETTGEKSPKPLGGDRRSGRIGSPSQLSDGTDPAHAGHHPAGDPGASDQELQPSRFEVAGFLSPLACVLPVRPC